MITILFMITMMMIMMMMMMRTVEIPMLINV